MYIIKESAKFKFLGVEEGEDTCAFCHKMHITKMFVVQNLETGDIERFGSQCIKKALDISTSDITRAKNTMLKDVLKRQNDEIGALENETRKLKDVYIKSGKDEKIPWQYSPELKAREKLRRELDMKHYREKELYK